MERTITYLLCAIVTISTSPRAGLAGDILGRYQMSAPGAGFVWRLDTTTGEIVRCDFVVDRCTLILEGGPWERQRPLEDPLPTSSLDSFLDGETDTLPRPLLSDEDIGLRHPSQTGDASQ